MIRAEVKPIPKQRPLRFRCRTCGARQWRPCVSKNGLVYNKCYQHRDRADREFKRYWKKWGEVNGHLLR